MFLISGRGRDHYYHCYYYFHCHCNCWCNLYHHRFPHHWWVHWHRRSYHRVFVNGISWVTAAGPFAPQGLKLLGIVPNWVAQETRVYIILLHEGSAFEHRAEEHRQYESDINIFLCNQLCITYLWGENKGDVSFFIIEPLN